MDYVMEVSRGGMQQSLVVRNLKNKMGAVGDILTKSICMGALGNILDRRSEICS